MVTRTGEDGVFIREDWLGQSDWSKNFSISWVDSDNTTHRTTKLETNSWPQSDSGVKPESITYWLQEKINDNEPQYFTWDTITITAVHNGMTGPQGDPSYYIESSVPSDTIVIHPKTKAIIGGD